MIEVNYKNVAKNILYTIENELPDFYITDEQLESVDVIAELLERYIEPELVAEISHTTVGCGILAGLLSYSFIIHGGSEGYEEDKGKNSRSTLLN